MNLIAALLKLAEQNPLTVSNNGSGNPPDSVAPVMPNARQAEFDRRAMPSRYRVDAEDPRKRHDPASWLKKKEK